MNLDKIDILISALIEEKKDITIKNLWKLYIQHCMTKNRDGAIQRYEKDFKQLNIFFEKNNIIMVSQITHETLDKFRIFKKKNCKAITINQQINNFKYACNFGIKRNYIRENPFKNYKSMIEDKYKGEILNEIEMKQIIQYLDKLEATDKNLKMKAIIFLMMETGLRMNEIKNLKIKDLSLDKNKIYLSFTKAHENRILYLTEKPKKTLSKYIERVKPKNFLFMRVKSTEQITDAEIKRFLNKIKNELHFNINLNNRLLRRSYATHLINSNIPINQVMELMGHEDMRTTQKYLKVYSKDLEISHNKISIFN